MAQKPKSVLAGAKRTGQGENWGRPARGNRLGTEIEQRDEVIANLRTELEGAKIKLKRLEPKPIDMDADTIKVLRLFFDTARELSIPQVSQQLQFQPSVTEFHFDELMRRRFLRQSRVGFGNHSGYFELMPDGRKYMMENRA